jgi:hypothetical protein
LTVDDPHEPGGYGLDETVVFDDWLDGVDGRQPEEAYASLRVIVNLTVGECTVRSAGGPYDAGGPTATW